MTPKEVLEKWIDCFNASDVEGIAALYADDAVNHQVANAPVAGKETIRRMFAGEFATAKMVCIVENIFEDGEWAILEWKTHWGCVVAASSISKTILLYIRGATGTNLVS